MEGFSTKIFLRFLLFSILENPEEVSRVGRNDETKVFKHRGKSPRGLTLTGPFLNGQRMLAPDWAQKMLCIIVTNQRIASPEFFFGGCPIRSQHSFDRLKSVPRGSSSRFFDDQSDSPRV